MTKHNFRLVSLPVIILLLSLNINKTNAQFLINGIEPQYDSATNTYLLSIDEKNWNGDYHRT